MDLWKAAKKEKAKLKVIANRERGKIAEGAIHQRKMAEGHDVRRRSDRKGGWDFDVDYKDPLTGKVIKKSRLEVKSSSKAKLSKKQKGAQKKHKNYEVARPMW